MDETFDLPVNYKGDKVFFKARLFTYGYTHRIQVTVNGYDILFEPDEEKCYRAIVSPDQYEKLQKQLDAELLRGIAESIESLVK